MAAMKDAILSRWQRFTVREQALLLVGALLALMCAVWLGLVQPALDWRERARLAYVGAAGDYRIIADGVARLSALNSAEAGVSDEREPVRSVVAGSASRAGIVLSRVLPDDAGRLNVWIDGVDAARLMVWLETLSQEHGVTVLRAGIEQAGRGSELRAQLLLLGRSGA
jgi:general secretion pathway protein M